MSKIDAGVVKINSDYQDIMEEITRLFEVNNNLEISDVLNPLESTDLDVMVHARFIQRLGIETIKKRLRYKKLMENHEVPVKFFPPEYKNFVSHMRYREINGASYHVLSHEKKTIMTYARAFDLDDKFKKYKLPKEPEKNNIYDVPYPYDVAKFSKFQYFPNIKCYKNKLYQTMHFHNFMVGFRAPSEMALMKLEYVDIDDNDNGKLSYPQPKRHNAIRNCVLPKSVISASNQKSFKNYIDKIRSKVENQYSKDYLYLQEDGKPFTIRHLGHKLSRTGKMVYKNFHPYMARHWCVIAKLIQTKVKSGGDKGTFDYFAVNRWIGHKNIQTTMEYAGPSIDYYENYPHDWYGHVLKQKLFGGKHDFPSRGSNKGLLGKVNPEKRYGLGEI